MLAKPRGYGPNLVAVRANSIGVIGLPNAEMSQRWRQSFVAHRLFRHRLLRRMELQAFRGSGAGSPVDWACLQQGRSKRQDTIERNALFDAGYDYDMYAAKMRTCEALATSGR